MGDKLFLLIIVVVMAATVGALFARCAAYDYDWRCMAGDCRIVKCSEGGPAKIERGD